MEENKRGKMIKVGVKTGSESWSEAWSEAWSLTERR